MKKRRRPVVMALYITFWVVILFMFGVLFFSHMEEYNKLQGQLAMLNAEIANEESETMRLETELLLFDSDIYVEQLAWERLSMIRPNEIVIRNIAD